MTVVDSRGNPANQAGLKDRIDCPSCGVTFKPKWATKRTLLDTEHIADGRRVRDVEIELSTACPVCKTTAKIYPR